MQRGKKLPYLAMPYGLLLEAGLSDCDKMVLALILSFYDNEKDFFIPAKNIGEKIGKSSRAAKYSIQKLLNGGYIQECDKKYKSKCYIPTEKAKSFLYLKGAEIAPQEYEEGAKTSCKGAEIAPQRVQNLQEKGAMIAPNKNTINNDYKKDDKHIDNIYIENSIGLDRYMITRDEFRRRFPDRYTADMDAYMTYFSDGTVE